MRNRIIHALPITSTDNEQILSTKDKDNNQFHISNEYLLEFIEKNEKLSIILHDYRGY